MAMMQPEFRNFWTLVSAEESARSLFEREFYVGAGLAIVAPASREFVTVIPVPFLGAAGEDGTYKGMRSAHRTYR